MSIGIDRFKASSHPTRADGIYLGVIKRILPDGRVYVYIPKLSNTVGPMRVTNAIEGTVATNNRVICAHVGGGTEEMYVVGNVETVTLEQISRDVRISMFMNVD